MKATIFVDRDNYKEVEEEEKNRFLKGVLQDIGIPVEDVWPGLSLSVEEKIELRKMLGKYDITILGQGGNVEIYVKDELVASWSRPRYRLLVDDKELDPAKKLFLEMTINCSSIFDEDSDWEEFDEQKT